MRRLTTGNDRLDHILGGGLVADAITLVVGAPGTGKTILAEQCMFANATVERPGLYLSTVSEPFDKLLRFGQNRSFFDTELVGRAVFYDDVGDAVHHGGLDSVSERIDSLVKQHHPGIIVIDSFKALRTFASSDADFRRFLHDLAGMLSAIAVSSLWVGEYEHDEATNSPEFAVADAVIGVETKRASERSTRFLSVRKLRGSDFLSGDHAYRITADGLVVFPRLADPRDTGSPMAVGERRSTGIAALDESLENGYWSGSTTLVAGPTGSEDPDGPALRLCRHSTRREGGVRHAPGESQSTRPHRHPVRLEHRRPERDHHGSLARGHLRRRTRLRRSRPSGDRRSAPTGHRQPERPDGGNP